ncbi:MAG: 2-isopropylmalate synthase [Treponema sp.]|jgi:2-isopropylmalate synthase|nr:2-isopropylmalate synthase [Treponema sp.]
MPCTEKRRIWIFDTTLRDGEQAPGCSMNLQEKLEVARRLELLRVDVIEAGFPASSRGDFEAVKSIAGIVRNSIVAGLCRCVESDIDAAREALANAKKPRIHVFIATSPIHMEHKLKMRPEEVMAQAAASVKYAREFCSDVEFSAEDAFRSDPDFVCSVFGAAIKAGANTVNFPDTVGFALPDEFGRRIRYIKENTPGIEKACLSVHCHNDLGLAAANSLAAIANGADQLECTVNGIGERAGNASLEEIVMTLRVRGDQFAFDTGIDSTQIYAASHLVSKVTGVKIPPNKAIVGDNAFAHEAGIHQHGVMANPATYEIMSPESIGLPKGKPGFPNRMILGKHSGKHALNERLKELGFTLDEQALNTVFTEFKSLADKKKFVEGRDLEALVMGVSAAVPETWTLEEWEAHTGSVHGAGCSITLRRKNGASRREAAGGDGPVDSIFKAINQIIEKEPELELYEIGAITGGSSSQGETKVKISWEGRRWNGRGVSTDIVESSIKAYIAAVNAMEWELCTTPKQ